MTINYPIPGVRRALTAAELDQVLTRIGNTETSEDLLRTALVALYDTLLADLGYQARSLPAGLFIEPSDFAIPASQWEAITDAVLNQAQRWGITVHAGLELINWMPASYDAPTVAAPAVRLPDRRPQQMELHLTRDAVDVIGQAHLHVAALAQAYGTDSANYRLAAASLLRHLCGLFSGLGAHSRVESDDAHRLSLLVTTENSFAYGITFRGDQRYCMDRDCGAALDEDGNTKRILWIAPTEGHVHVPSYPLDGPQPGAWSARS